MTHTQLLQEIEAAFAAGSDPEGAMTSEDLAAQLGLGIKATRERLKRLKAAGRLEVVSVDRVTLAGNVSPVPAYRIIAE